MNVAGTELEQEPELSALRARVSELEGHVQELERQLGEQAVRANAAIAAAQERAYWLDRWHLDLNALMRRRGAGEIRAFLRAVRAVVRRLQRLVAGAR